MRDLQIVLTLAEAGSTVRAAAALHLTQSAVSRGLCLAEEKLGLKIFERGARGLVPTTAGERLIAGASGVLAELVELERRAAEPVAAPLELRLACECYTAYRWLPSTLARLEQSLSSVQLKLCVEHTLDPVSALLDDELDIALLTTGVVRRPLQALPLFSDEIVFLVSMSHPLAERATITRQHLVDYPLLTPSQTPKSEVSWFIKTTFGPSPPKLKSLQLPLTEAIVDAARASMGIAVLSEWIASPYLEAGDLALKRLQGAPIRRPWRIAFRPESAGPARQLASILKSAPPRVYPRALAKHA